MIKITDGPPPNRDKLIPTIRHTSLPPRLMQASITTFDKKLKFLEEDNKLYNSMYMSG